MSLAAVVAMLGLTARCVDSTASDDEPERPTTAVPAGPIAVVGESGFFVSDGDGETVLNRIAQDGTIDSIGAVPLESSVAVQGVSGRLLITGVHQQHPDGCTSDDCGVRQYQALWVAPNGKVLESTTLRKAELIRQAHREFDGPETRPHGEGGRQ